MSYKITNDCLGCGVCEAECDNEAISEGEDIYEIDPHKCTECIGISESPKCAEVCPAEVCVPDANYEESKEQLLKKWQQLHPGEEPSHTL